LCTAAPPYAFHTIGDNGSMVADADARIGEQQ
jgi:hypothetical protein